jgi:hypothetical protein
MSLFSYIGHMVQRGAHSPGVKGARQFPHSSREAVLTASEYQLVRPFFFRCLPITHSACTYLKTSELLAVIWATVAVNQLTETVIEPSANVWELLRRPWYDLAWAATNSHFLFGEYLGCPAW